MADGSGPGHRGGLAGQPRAGDLKLPITLGPLPTDPGRLQLKVLQTWSNGDVDHWIDEWPEGAPEPGNPGPVLDLVAGGSYAVLRSRRWGGTPS
jgi:Domain of unkown function (DUF1775)